MSRVHVYYVNTLFGDFIVKVGRENTLIFRPAVGNESLHEIINDNGNGVVKYAASENLNFRELNVPTSQHS
jgi:hypothetical protein